jgi:hypothetical protein
MPLLPPLPPTPIQCCVSPDSSWLPCAITRCNKQSWLCQDVMYPSYEGPSHLSRSRHIGRRISTLSSFRGLVILSLERARSANGVDFVHSQSAASYEATLETLVVTASGVTMVRAAMRPPWEMRLLTATLGVMMVMGCLPPRKLLLCLGDRLDRLAIQLNCKGTYEAFYLFASTYKHLP